MSRQLGNYLIFAMYFSRPKNSFRQRFFHRSAAHENDGHLVKEKPTRADRKVVSSSGECQEFLEQPKTHKKKPARKIICFHTAPQPKWNVMTGEQNPHNCNGVECFAIFFCVFAVKSGIFFAFRLFIHGRALFGGMGKLMTARGDLETAKKCYS